MVGFLPDRMRTESSELLPRKFSRSALLFKRGVDLIITLPLCILLLPLFLLIGVAIKLDSRGPVFFRQERIGENFVPFTIVKFRSLQTGVPDPSSHYEMLEEDPRITRIGALLRRTSLDELPQLFQVLIGSMSLVGPRPLVEWESREALVNHAERFDVKPGITGLCQISVRNAADMMTRFDKDVDYVRNWSPLLDLRILLQTPRSLFDGETIYPNAS